MNENIAEWKQVQNKKKEQDQIVLDADPVEAVALTYDSEHIPVKYQKIGQDARTPQRGSAQAADMMFTLQLMQLFP